MNRRVESATVRAGPLFIWLFGRAGPHATTIKNMPVRRFKRSGQIATLPNILGRLSPSRMSVSSGSSNGGGHLRENLRTFYGDIEDSCFNPAHAFLL
jgi:hypothetical protein